MKQIIFAAILILAFSFITSAQKGSFLLINTLSFRFDELVRFDEFEKLSPEEEKVRLDNLFTTVKKGNSLKSLIVLKLNKNESRRRRIKRLKRIAEHFDFRKIDKTKFTLAVFNVEKEQTIFWIEPQDVNLKDLLSGETETYELIKAEEFERKIKDLIKE